MASGQFGVSFNGLLLIPWLHDADPPLAPIRRSRSGSNMPVSRWRLHADHQMAPIRRSVTESSKSKRDHVVILNDAAWSIVQAQRGLHPIWVFAHRGHRMTGMNNTGWQNARRAVGLDRLHVHDLRHTFACRLRAAGVAAEDRAAMLGRAEHSMPGHYASADVGRFVDLANLVLKRQETRTVLRVANGWPVEPTAERLWIPGPAAVPQ